MKTLGLILLSLSLTAAASAAYVYDFPNLLSPYVASQWNINGSLNTTTLPISSSTGGSLIFKSTIPGNPAAYEVKATFNVGSTGGNYLIYLRATSNALLSANQGTFYAVKVENPTYTGSECDANLHIVKEISGVATTLQNTRFVCSASVVVRAVITQSNQILAYVNGVQFANISDTTITSGQPGVGINQAPSGNAITTVDIGHQDTVAPSAVTSIGSTAFRDRVYLQWPATTDDTNGTGIALYQIFRNSDLIGDVYSTTFEDFTAVANNTYTYSVQAFDFHGNGSTTTNANVSIPATVIDPRETGVRPTGSYWGGGGENIDMRSGNLNFTLPILKGVGRGGWGVGFQLSYNSQNWRQDTGGTWQLGQDLGLGYGWRLQAGSLTPLYSSAWVLAGYMFIDGTGAEYFLKVNNAGIWSSTESIYVYYDSTAGILHFTDGSFWTMGATSAITEPDAGTMYPTQMEDSNGNQVLVQYGHGAGGTAVNTSARINWIEDVRGKGSSDYTFTYNLLNSTDLVPHLTDISNTIGTAENFTFTYNNNVSLISPFDQVTSFGTVATLHAVKLKHILTTYWLGYDAAGSGELDKVTMPYGGYLRWSYTQRTLASTLNYREVQSRFLSMSSGASETEIDLNRNPGDSTYNFHPAAILDDSPSNSEKFWSFDTTTTDIGYGLQASYEERTKSSGVALSHLDFTWAQTPTSLNPYIGTTVTRLDPGTNEVDKQSVQTLDQYGNLTQLQQYNFGAGAPGSLARTYNNTFLSTSGYTSRYIYNRLKTSTVTDGTNSTTLVSNTYDDFAVTSVTGLHEHDDTNYPATFNTRGNVSSSNTLTKSSTIYYDMAGNVTKTVVNGVTTNVTTDSTTNYAAPTQMTTNTLSSQMSYSSFLGPQSATDPAGDTGSIAYTVDARPQTVTSPYGAVTTYTYNDTATPPNQYSTTNGHSVTTIMDGFGRTIETFASDATSAKSIVDAQYAPCGCSPLGKMFKKSQPYAQGGTPVWTTYYYDASGRTTSVVLPDNSTTYYVYQGNKVTVTDPATHSKTFTMDAFGNLVTVAETDPTLGAVTTTYTYDILNHLTQVSMPRGATTQTRTFNYKTGTTVGAFLMSATNPENGTVTYTYNNNLIATKTDAKGQELYYYYDGYLRLNYVNWSSTPGGTQTNLRTYYYDTNPLDTTGFTQNAAGRLAAVQYPAMTPPTGMGTETSVQLTDMYSYIAPGTNGAGLPSAKRLQVAEPVYYMDINNQRQQTTVKVNLDSTYTYNNEGKVTAMTYPATINGLNVSTPGPTYNYSYDTMYRLGGMTDGNSNTIVNNVSYNAANQLLSMNYPGASETRSYNALNQLTNIHAGSSENLTYNYPAGTNNGKVSSMYNAVSGETVTYTYDSLNRIATANGSGWGEQYTFDPFGNLTTKTASNAPALSIVVNPANNHAPGSYDANGNALASPSGVVLTYDVENHVLGTGWNNFADPAEYYAYDAQSRRIWMWAETVDSLNNTTSYGVMFYSPMGQKLGTYTFTAGKYLSGGNYHASLSVALSSSDQYFGARRLAVMDELDSAGTYFPWGEAKGGTNPQDTWSYATYWRDSATGLDYANRRQYSNVQGRFMSPDPYQASGRTFDPQSWNEYAYTGGDPVNRADPRGTDWCDVGFVAQIVPGTSCGGPPGTENYTNWPNLADLIAADVAAVLAQVAQQQTSLPPLQCKYVGYSAPPGYVRPGNQPNINEFGDPINLYYLATGGTGNYTFYAQQIIQDFGTVTYSGGATINATSQPILDGIVPGVIGRGGPGGSNGSYTDAPGVNLYVPAYGNVVSASLFFAATTTVEVFDGVNFVQCGTVTWNARINWPLNGTPSGQATVTSPL
jgi:RHS repeat-associated protein